MKRIKKAIRCKETNERFQIYISKINPKIIWKPCHWCKHEFRREEGYKIELSEPINLGNPSEYYYICNECSNKLNEEELRLIWKNSAEFKLYKNRR